MGELYRLCISAMDVLFIVSRTHTIIIAREEEKDT